MNSSAIFGFIKVKALIEYKKWRIISKYLKDAKYKAVIGYNSPNLM